MGASAAEPAVAHTASLAAADLPRTYYVYTANGRVEAPNVLYPGRYYVQLRTRDTDPTEFQSKLQIVRPARGYTPRQFVLDWARWEQRNLAGDAEGAQAQWDALNRQVTFVKGASTVPNGVSAFGTYFSSGTYWLYEDRAEGPNYANRIKVLTVKGGVASVNAYQPYAATAAYRGERLTLSATVLPRLGWLNAANLAGTTRGWTIWRLPPGLDESQAAACIGAPALAGAIASPSPTAPDCAPVFVQSVGLASAGVGGPARLNLLPGEYVLADNRPDRAGSSPVARGQYARFTVR
ncbi:hypothetical protein [Motilibacter aurantiacus]|uniref:hypothetical protein n=1 Tax=Motilibacter aurantiacus TaxID=2714955 RepID=UPI00140CE205|nr:hypothetical protein [Motilibacter aurantiacus]NHC46883.1 hypothetical protein [Motilibacter aurantiacus]